MNEPIDYVIWYFFLYSMLGYVCEVCYCSLPAKRLVNRGFLHGPYIPVYGFGALVVVMLLNQFKSWPFIIFFGGVVVTSVIEYGTGYLLEKVFHIRLWDYRDRKFQFRGRICMMNSTLFGFLSLAVVYVIHPYLQQGMAIIGERLRTVGASGILLILAVDTTTSVLSMTAFTERLQQIKRLKAMLEPRIELLAQSRQRLVEALEAEVIKVTEQLRRSGNRMLDAFPGMSSEDLDAPLSLIRDLIQKRHTREEQRKKRGTRHDND